MWISKIELTAFKSYQRQSFDFPKPKGDRNIVLIGGMNGYGKTSILEALYLCLFGKDAMSHLARAGLKTDDKAGYPTFLERAFNGEARRDGQDTMIVRVVISHNASKAYEITRKWFFRSTGSWNDEEATVRTLTRDVPDFPRSDGKDNFFLSDLLDEVFVPPHVAPFFFFDGEEVKKLADQSRVEQVKQGLEGLLGVVLLRSLSQRLRTFENSRRDGLITVDEVELDRIHNDLEEAERTAKEQREALKGLAKQRESFDDSLQSRLDRITSAGGGGATTATFKELIEEREQFRAQLKQTHDALESTIADKLPFQLVSAQVRRDLKEQLQSESKLVRWETEKAALEPRKKEFDDALLGLDKPPIEPPLSEAQHEAVTARISAAWARMFFPPPNDCASEIVHGYLTAQTREELIKYLDGLWFDATAISSQISRQKEYETKISDRTRRISKLEGIENDGTLALIRKELEEIQENIKNVEDQTREADRKLNVAESSINNLRATYEREKKKLYDSSPARAVLNKSGRVRQAIEEVIPALFPLKVKALAKSMTEVYKQLAHKDQVSKIEISPEGHAQILGKSGKPIAFDRSAGENQIFATALIAGLAYVSGVKAPLVVDTPLGRLDSKHRANILAFWTSDKSRQVILLSQDEEISGELMGSIESSVSKTYLLEHIEVGDGIGRTTARVDSYFGARK